MVVYSSTVYPTKIPDKLGEGVYQVPSGNLLHFANWKMAIDAIEIVSFPINSLVIFHSYVSLPEGKMIVFF